MDRAGRVVVPRSLREVLGLPDGGVVEVSIDGAGLAVVAGGRTARLVESDDGPVLESDTVVTDDDIFRLVGGGRP